MTDATRKLANARQEAHINSILEEKKATGKRGFTSTQNYEELQKQCVEAKSLFEDPEFPADDESIGLDTGTRKFVWKRPKV